MQSSSYMQQIVAQIAIKHGVDLSKVGASMRLDMPHMDRLCIERISHHEVSVAHYFEANGDLIAEPDIVFYVVNNTWYPIQIQQSITGWQELANITAGVVEHVATRRQADVARFADYWARNIKDQNWLEYGTLTRVERGV